MTGYRPERTPSSKIVKTTQTVILTALAYTMRLQILIALFRNKHVPIYDTVSWQFQVTDR